MKIKHDFVTNSSSTSYILAIKPPETEREKILLEQLYDHIFKSKKEFFKEYDWLEDPKFRDRVIEAYDTGWWITYLDIPYGSEDGFDKKKFQNKYTVFLTEGL